PHRGGVHSRRPRPRLGRAPRPRVLYWRRVRPRLAGARAPHSPRPGTRPREHAGACGTAARPVAPTSHIFAITRMTSAPNPKFAHTAQLGRLRTSGSKGALES